MFKLNNHPFAVEAHFQYSLVLTYAVPKEELISLLPPCLTPDTLNNEYGFVAAAFVNTQNLRPKGFPEFMGNDFFLIGYRIFVRYKDQRGKNLRGLYILRSETNKKKMEYLGSIFTKYKYKTSNIKHSFIDGNIHIQNQEEGLIIEASKNSETIPLPLLSPFQTWQEARRFAGPLPFTFSFNKNNNEVIIVEGVRENWIPQPLWVTEVQIPYIEQMPFSSSKLANAFIIENIPYYWKKGRTEIWQAENHS